MIIDKFEVCNYKKTYQITVNYIDKKHMLLYYKHLYTTTKEEAYEIIKNYKLEKEIKNPHSTIYELKYGYYNKIIYKD